MISKFALEGLEPACGSRLQVPEVRQTLLQALLDWSGWRKLPGSARADAFDMG
jgi:hypothetical protein